MPIIGGGGNDTLTGTSDPELINGLGGNDVLSGGGGADTLIGDAGNDTLNGGAGSDIYKIGLNDGFDTFADSGLVGFDMVVATADNVVIGIASGFGPASGIEEISANGFTGITIAGDSTDTTLNFSHTVLDGIDAINGGQGNDNITGSATGDTIRGNLGDDVVFGGLGNDSLFGGGGADVLFGGAGGDFMSGGSDNDVMLGGDGNDTMDGGDGFDDLHGGDGNDVLTGGAHIDRLGGGAGDDFLDGGDDVDFLDGGTENDTLLGGAGVDILLGGGGNDRLDGGEDSDDYLIGLNAGFDAFADSGTVGVDRIVATDNDVAIGIKSGFGPGSGIEIITADGHTGITIQGDVTSDILNFSTTTLDGIDAINGGDGSDRITGSADADVIMGDIGNDTLFGGLGNDSLFGGVQDDAVNGGAGDDALTGGLGSDTLNGGEDSDTYNIGAGAGFDTFADSGTAGFDLIVATADTVTIGINSGFGPASGIEEISAGGHLNVTIQGDITNDTLNFSQTILDGIAAIDGGSGNDSIVGSVGNDSILGRVGLDTLNGGGGADTLAGGVGADKFIFASESDSAPGAADTIADFVHASDIIGLGLIDANTSVVGNQIFAFGGHNAATVANTVTWFEDSGNTIIHADVNGDTTPELEIVLTGTGLGLTAADFVL